MVEGLEVYNSKEVWSIQGNNQFVEQQEFEVPETGQIGERKILSINNSWQSNYSFRNRLNYWTLLKRINSWTQVSLLEKAESMDESEYHISDVLKLIEMGQ